MNWQLLKSALSNYAGRFFSVCVSFLLIPFVLAKLGAAQFGLWAVVSAFAGYGALLDLGIAAALVKHVSEYRARNDLASARRFVSTSLALYLGLCALGLLFSAAGAWLFGAQLSGQTGSGQTHFLTIFCAGAAVAISIPCSVPTAVLRGLGRFDIVNALRVAETLINAAATVLALAAGGGVLSLIAVNVTVVLLMQLPAIRVVHRIAPELRLDLSAACRHSARSILSFSSSVFLSQLAGRLQAKSDELIIAAFLPLTAVTPYAMGRRLSTLPQMLTDQFVQVLLPFASALHAGDERHRVQSFYLSATRITMALYAPLGCFIALLSGSILRLWLGRELTWAAEVCTLLTVSGFIDLACWPSGSVLQAMNRHRALGWVALASGIVNVLLSIVLLRSYGIPGVAWGTLIATALECAGFVVPFTLHVLEIPFASLLREALLPAILPTIPAGLVLLLAHAIVPTSFVALAGTGLLTAAVYAAFYLSIPGTDPERVAERNAARVMFVRLSQGVARAVAGGAPR